jgi:alpha-L-fucosidase
MKLYQRFFVICMVAGVWECGYSQEPIPETAIPTIIVNTASEPIAAGKFKPTWDSLKQYQAPEWFRNAKFGIWAHWGPQCAPEDSDWYARNMYVQGHPQNRFQIEHYGPPSQFGFKDVIHTWKAENWDPQKLVALYKRTGAQYFVALGNHHDNFDLWDSQYQPWNAVKVGPQKDLIAGWAQAAHDQGLPFGVSLHAAHAWSWYEISQSADKTGPLAGIPYDGKLTKADGKGKWWDGLDPQDLYEQRHTPSPNFASPGSIHGRWDWNNGVTLPDQAYCDKFYNRTADLISKYHPDLLYFDDDALPLWPVSDAGLKIAADFYNSNTKWHDGKLEAVILGKQLDEAERKCIVWDIERGTSNRIEPFPWETDTCIGNWHYSRAVYDGNHYKNARTVIRMLADIVSKNGNLLLNIPVRGDGTIDDKEEVVLKGIAGWMDVNRECIFDTRPWKVFGEGPASEGPVRKVGNFNEGKGKPFTGEDVRFTSKNGMLYIITLGVPKSDLNIKSLGATAKLLDYPISDLTLLGSNEKLHWSQTTDALTIQVPQKIPNDIAIVFRITLNDSATITKPSRIY